MGNQGSAKHPGKTALDERLWKSAHFWNEGGRVFLSEHSRLGLAGTITGMDFHHSRKILGICTSLGRIQLLGKPGITKLLQTTTNDDGYIHSLRFAQHSSDFVTISSQSVIEHWDMQKLAEQDGLQKKIIFRQLYNQEITVCEVSSSFQSQFVFLGTNLGSIFTYDLGTKSMSAFKLLCPEEFGKTCINSIRMHPRDDELMLVAYSNSLILLWNLKHQRVDKTFSLDINSNKMTPRSISFKSDGTQFVAGTHCGNVIVFDSSESNEPVLVKYASEAKPAPIRQIQWVKPCLEFMDGFIYASKDKNGVEVYDGRSFDTITSLSFSDLQVNHMVLGFTPSDTMARIKKESAQPPHMVVSDPIGNAFYAKPDVNETSETSVNLVPIIESTLTWKQVEVFSYPEEDVEEFIDCLMKWRYHLGIHDLPEHLCLLGNWLFDGGKIAQDEDKNVLVAALQRESGIISFWKKNIDDVSYVFSIEIDDSLVSSHQENGVVLSKFAICLKSKQIVVGCESGEVIVTRVRPVPEDDSDQDSGPLEIDTIAGMHLAETKLICFDSPNDRLAIADADGVVSLFDTDSGQFLMYDILADSMDLEKVAITCLKFSASLNTLVDQKSVLYVGLSNGTFRFYDLATGQVVLSNFPFPNSPAFQTEIRFIECVKQIGRPCDYKVIIPEVESESQSNENSAADSTKPPIAPLKPSPRGSVSTEQSFLIASCSNIISVFDSNMNPVHTVTTDGSVLCAQIVAIEEFENAVNYGLVVIDEGSYITFYSLMDLNVIYHALLPVEFVPDSDLIRISRDGNIYITTKDGECVHYNFFEDASHKTDTTIWTQLRKSDAVFCPPSAALGEERRLKKSQSVFKKIVSSLQTPLIDQLNTPEPLIAAKRPSPIEEKDDIHSEVKKTTNVLQESVQQAQRNVDKAKQVADKSEAMANRSADFLKTAQALKNKQKSWF